MDRREIDISLLFPENRIWHFMQIVSLEVQCRILFSGENEKKDFKMSSVDFFSSMLSINFCQRIIIMPITAPLIWGQNKHSIPVKTIKGIMHHDQTFYLILQTQYIVSYYKQQYWKTLFYWLIIAKLFC